MLLLFKILAFTFSVLGCPKVAGFFQNARLAMQLESIVVFIVDAILSIFIFSLSILLLFLNATTKSNASYHKDKSLYP